MSVKQEERWGVFWYNKDAITKWSDKEFEAKAAEFAANGVNVVMTFSCTHFRWSYYPWWKQINAAIGRIVKACRKYNIKVVEHHSCHLTHDPRTAGEWQTLEQSFSKRQSSLALFDGLKDFIASGDPEIAPGVHLSDCRQIDGRTGDYARTNYRGYAHCFNNLHFRKAYFDYLADVYAVGVDGIMTDDVHFFGYFHACSCKFCREKFRQETGYELPQPKDWGKFHGDFSNKVFVAWLQFRMRSTAEFQRAVNEHFTALGYKLLRPNYSTSTFNWNQTAYPFETARELWTTVFQENMFSSVISQSWLSWMGIAAHRRAMARRNNCYAMSMFYPDRRDSYYFCWALARSWNHLLMATPEGCDLNEVEKHFAAFSNLHPVSDTPVELADVFFMQPRSSIDYTADGLEASGRPLKMWMQAAACRNLQCKIIFEDELAGRVVSDSLLVLPGATMLSDKDLADLQHYCAAGGRVLITGAFGIYQPDGTRREHPEKIFGFSAELSEYEPVSEGKFEFNGRTVPLPAVEKSHFLSHVSGDCRVIAADKNGKVLGVEAMQGNLIWLAGGVTSHVAEAEQYASILNRWAPDGNTVTAKADHYAADYLYEVPGVILQVLLKKEPFIQCSSRDYSVSVFASEDRKKYAVNLVNTSKTLARKGESYSHADRLVNFMPDAARNLHEITLHLVLGSTFAGKVQAFSPEFDQALELAVVQHGSQTVITVPEECFSGYLEIDL